MPYFPVNADMGKFCKPQAARVLLSRALWGLSASIDAWKEGKSLSDFMELLEAFVPLVVVNLGTLVLIGRNAAEWGGTVAEEGAAVKR